MESEFTHSPAFFFLSAEGYLSVLKPRFLRWELHPAAVTLMAFFRMLVKGVDKKKLTFEFLFCLYLSFYTSDLFDSCIYPA